MKQLAIAALSLMVFTIGCASQNNNGAPMSVADGHGYHHTQDDSSNNPSSGHNTIPVHAGDVQRLASKSDHQQVRDALDALELAPETDRCDEEVCRVCDRGTRTAFQHDGAQIEIRSCCRDGGCINLLQFHEHHKAVGVVGPRLEPKDLLADGSKLMVSPKATSQTGDQALFSVSMQTLRDRGTSVDEPLTLVGLDELQDESEFSISADAFHRLESLPARALEEGEEQCEQGHHLPTLLDIAESMSPRSSSLELQFERWVGKSHLLFSTQTDDNSKTRVHVDRHSECFRRFGLPHWPASTADVEVWDGVSWVQKDVRVVYENDHSFLVIRGEIVGTDNGGEPHPDQIERLEATVQADGDSGVEGTPTVLRRMVSDAEIAAHLAGQISSKTIANPTLEAPASFIDAQWRLPVTVIVDSPEEVADPTIRLSVE